MGLALDRPVRRRNREAQIAPFLDKGGAVFNVKAYGAKGDGTTDDRASFVAVEDAGDHGFAPASSYLIGSNLTLSKAWTLANGAMLKPANGVTITITGSLDAGLCQAFDLSLGGSVVFGEGAVSGVLPAWFGTGGAAVKHAVTACCDGGVVDCRALANGYVLDVDISSGLAAFDKKSITFLWPSGEVRCKVSQTVRSNHTHVLAGTTFTARDENGAHVTGVSAFTGGVLTPVGGATITDGSSTITKSDPSNERWGYLEVGSPLLIFGEVNPLSTDDTLLNGAIDADDTTINVDSTTGFLSGGFIRIEDEIIQYSGITATSFTGCTRGVQGTTAAVHADNTPVYRPTYGVYTVEAIDGDDITLAFGESPDFSATAALVVLGPLNVRFEGTGTFDGHATQETNESPNALGIDIQGSRNFYVSPGISFKRWDHGGVTVRNGQDFSVHGQYEACGHRGLSLGAGVWVFGRSKRGAVDVASVRNQHAGVTVDDRTGGADHFDGTVEDVSVLVHSATGVRQVVALSGTRRCSGEYRQATIAASNGEAGIVAGGQWVTNVGGSNIELICGPVTGVSGFRQVHVGSMYADKSVRVRLAPISGASWSVGGIPEPSGSIPNTETGVLIERSERSYIVPESSNTFTPSLPFGSVQIVDIDDATAKTIANAVAPVHMARMTVHVINSTAGALGGTSWGSEYRLAGAWVDPAAGQMRSIEFVRRGGLWREVSRSAADQSYT